jgi:hypothetical protein
LAGPIVRGWNLQFFLARAEQAAGEAEAATLSHVRERCRRSEAAWSALADKAQRSESLRIEDQKRKAANAATISNEDDIQEHQSQDDFSAPERQRTTTS